MLFLVDPKKAGKKVCTWLIVLCPTKCWDVSYPLYGIPDDDK